MMLNNLGIADAVFMDLLRNSIAEMGRMFVEEDVAVRALQMVASEHVNALHRVRFKFTSDQYFRYLMLAVYRFNPSTDLNSACSL